MSQSASDHEEEPELLAERRQNERRQTERREDEDRREQDRRDEERRQDARRAAMAHLNDPLPDPDLKREDGGVWPSLDWRAGNRRLDDRRDNERRDEERRAGTDRRQGQNERRIAERRKNGKDHAPANITNEPHEAIDDDDLAEAGDYKGGLD